MTEEIADYAANIQTFVDEGLRRHRDRRLPHRHRHAAAAKANPDVNFIGVDQGICVDENGESDPTFTCAGDAATLIPNYQGIVFAEAQPGYLAGIVAASLSESGTIGAVGGTNVPAVVRYMDGYDNGAQSVNPDIEVLYHETNPTRSSRLQRSDQGQEIAKQMIDQDADVIFQIAGLTGRACSRRPACAGIYGIGVDVDQARQPSEPRAVHRHQRREEARGHGQGRHPERRRRHLQGGTVRTTRPRTPPAIGLSRLPRQRRPDHARDPGARRCSHRGFEDGIARSVRAGKCPERAASRRSIASQQPTERRSQDRLR